MKNKEKLQLTEDIIIDKEFGLTEAAVAERIKKGYINNVKIGTSKTYFGIFFGNLFTFFNILSFAIFVWLVTIVRTFDDAKNLTFMFIILANIIIGIAQEIRAKRTMDKLSLMSSPNVTVRRFGKDVIIKLNEILLGDIMNLKSGSQVCSDAIIIQGEVEVNEALLTGESQAIKKGEGDQLLSGSFIVSGQCISEVDHVGADNYIQRLSIDAKKFKKPESELLHSLKLIMRIIGVLILPIAIGAFFTNWSGALVEIAANSGIAIDSVGLFAAISQLDLFSSAQLYDAYVSAVTPTSAAMIGMIPAGLFLLTSMALAVGVIKLGKKNALVQELYSIETLARVDMLCLDKTGTITDGTMSVRAIEAATLPNNEIGDIISSMQSALGESNQTADALAAHFGSVDLLKSRSVIPFSSDRKCSAVTFEDGTMYILGAPEYATGKIDAKLQTIIDNNSKQGFRCLLLCSNKNVENEEIIPNDNTPIGVVVIEDNIKSDAVEIISYFKQNGVDVRVISGDNPITVSEVARRVGIDNAEKYISLQHMTDEEIKEIALEYTVFGRVNPHQKKLLVQQFKAAKHIVAMTGDGINDILALKEADCSIAMANGSEATRNVAHIVLLDSNFASMPKVVSEGRRVVNNIERASSLFLSKTAFSMVFQLILIFMGMELPLEPVQLSFISFFIIGVPSFFLALEPNNNLIEGKFIVNVARRVIPGSIAVVLNVVLVMIFTQATNLISIPDAQLNSVVLISIYLTFAVILFNVCKPFNRNRIILFASISFLAVLCIVVSPYVGDIMNIFKLVSVKDAPAVFMIMSMLLISIIVIKGGTYVMERVKYDDNKKLYFDVDIKKVWSDFIHDTNNLVNVFGSDEGDNNEKVDDIDSVDNTTTSDEITCDIKADNDNKEADCIKKAKSNDSEKDQKSDDKVAKIVAKTDDKDNKTIKKPQGKKK